MKNYVKCLNKAVELNLLSLTRYEYNLVYNVCSCLDKETITNKQYRRMIECVYILLEELPTFEYEYPSSPIVDDVYSMFKCAILNAIPNFGGHYGISGYYYYLILENKV